MLSPRAKPHKYRTPVTTAKPGYRLANSPKNAIDPPPYNRYVKR